jgi:F-type H+-transporting ATPase subunit b
MIEINFGILATQIVTFLIGLFLLWKIAWGPLTAAMKKRQDEIRRNIDSARLIKEEVEQLKAKYMSEMGRLEQRAAEIIAGAASEARKVHEDIMKEATTEARAFTERTHKYLEKQRKQMMDEVRAEIAKFAVMGAEKILKQSVSKEVQDKAVDEIMKELENMRFGEHAQ